MLSRSVVGMMTHKRKIMTHYYNYLCYSDNINATIKGDRRGISKWGGNGPIVLLNDLEARILHLHLRAGCEASPSGYSVPTISAGWQKAETYSFTDIYNTSSVRFVQIVAFYSFVPYTFIMIVNGSLIAAFAKQTQIRPFYADVDKPMTHLHIV